eukprot:5813915-Pleurochrysis_carterae.AAC.3
MAEGLSEREAAELAAQEAEDEAMRSFLPMSFGKVQEQKGPNLEVQHAAFEREGAVTLLASHGARGRCVWRSCSLTRSEHV